MKKQIIFLALILSFGTGVSLCGMEEEIVYPYDNDDFDTWEKGGKSDILSKFDFSGNVDIEKFFKEKYHSYFEDIYEKKVSLDEALSPIPDKKVEEFLKDINDAPY